MAYPCKLKLYIELQLQKPKDKNFPNDVLSDSRSV
jgi:hypothetical protein